MSGAEPTGGGEEVGGPDAIAERVRQLWPGAHVRGVERLRGDASSREYFRIVLDAAGAAPPSLILMRLGDTAVALSSEELGVYGTEGPTELPFVNVWRFLRSLGNAVPDIHDIAADRRTLLLEDVGDVTLWDAAENEAGRTALFENALAWLADLQRRARDDGRCYAFRQAFDERLFAWEFEHFVEYGLADTAPSLLAAVRRELAVAARELAGLPRMFCHRDYHAWNIHWQPGDRLRVIDFQDALLGPRLYDVASLLTDRMTPERITEDVEKRLVCHFADLVEDSPWTDEEQLLDQYRTIALQRVLKVVGRFNYLSEVKGKPAYLSMLPAVAATATRLLANLQVRFPATGEALDRFGKTGQARRGAR